VSGEVGSPATRARDRAGANEIRSTAGWTRIAELGSRRALRFAGWLVRRVGRRPMLALLWLPSLYFYLRSETARRGSRQYLARIYAATGVREGQPSRLDVLRHLHAFAINIYDRILLWSGQLALERVEHDGSAELFELTRQGRSALLLGAHLGCVDMLWSISRDYDLAINVVVFYRNAERINAFFESLAPGARLRAIEIDPESVSAAFQIKTCLDRGEFVVLLADRLPPGAAARAAEASFLGAPAQFPFSPFLAATVLGCPVYYAACLRTSDLAYRTILRPLRPAGRFPRSEREKVAEELLRRYVAELEHDCAQQPLQWFNFYEFWPEARA
jgi:predicted LPLAT superfamily acyltransferase